MTEPSCMVVAAECYAVHVRYGLAMCAGGGINVKLFTVRTSRSSKKAIAQVLQAIELSHPEPSR
jgi:hypothetical protein